MSITNATVLTGGSIAVTGGSSVAYSVSQNSGDTVLLAVGADTDLRLRRTIKLSASLPKPSTGAPNGYTQARGKAVIRHPILLANGKYTTCSVNIDIAFDAEMSATEKRKMLDTAAQIFFDSDFTQFVEAVSLG